MSVSTLFFRQVLAQKFNQILVLCKSLCSILFNIKAWNFEFYMNVVGIKTFTVELLDDVEF